MVRLLGIASILFVAMQTQGTSASSRSHKRAASHEHQQSVISNYLKLWNGDSSVVDSVLSPRLSLHADQFPSPTGEGSVPIEVDSSEEFLAFVQRSRTGWEKYNFEVYKSAAQGNNIAIRWRLEAVMGANFTLVPRYVLKINRVVRVIECSEGLTFYALYSPLKPGDPVTYNGTDFLVLNKCTGLVEEIHMAQDIITFFNALGLTAITV